MLWIAAQRVLWEIRRLGHIASQERQEGLRRLHVLRQSGLDALETVRASGLHGALLRHWEGSIVRQAVLGVDHQALQALSAASGAVVHEVVDDVGGITQVRNNEVAQHVAQVLLRVRLEPFEGILALLLQLDDLGLRLLSSIATGVTDHYCILAVNLESAPGLAQAGELGCQGGLGRNYSRGCSAEHCATEERSAIDPRCR
mmetsp:Transcript_68630/g.149366  ORF Transcript_68630/g.149366 Transcript_68630/m.149366 type:complete len:201 (+) Transcript_68630:82-684(+)